MKVATTDQQAGVTATRRLARILTALRATSPAMNVELDHRTPWELLVATILSAQCTDQRVNQVTPNLFRRYQHPHEYASADPAELEALIRPTGFFKTKARNLIRCAKTVAEQFHGEVPDTMEALTTLPGVGRKTANVLLGNAFEKPAIVVDTHVKRVAGRLDLTRHTDPEKIEMDLQRLLPADQWTEGSQRLLLHGRYICLARTPKCRHCPIYADCRWKGKTAR
ncbi:MAG: endonuclease III [Nitrospira sp.]|jgi:endonuclease-3|uniref:Endonuclease III n=1 Tax=Nitrospira defluvii TaxID=330214 RepID=D8PFY3_9BACT|nr:endonuclease III [Nitrospira sp.]CBK42170.1 Endonuclease III [Nitrospira defluvii]